MVVNLTRFSLLYTIPKRVDVTFVARCQCLRSPIPTVVGIFTLHTYGRVHIACAQCLDSKIIPLNRLEIESHYVRLYPFNVSYIQRYLDAWEKDMGN
jgi:hypothetical protein